MNNIILKIILAVGYIIIAPFAGGFLAGLDRVISARMQGRKGPSVWQAYRDIRKLNSKELLVVNHIQGILLMSYLVLSVVPGVMLYTGYGLLITIFISSTASMFFVLAGASTDSPFSNLGTQREMLQMMCVEPIELLTAVGFYMACGSFSADVIIHGDIPAIVKLPGVFIALVVALIMKMRKSPFDLSTSHHAHQELVKGITTEMVADYLSITEVCEWFENVFLLSIIAMFFMSGSGVGSIIRGIAASLIVWFFVILVDNTTARLKWQTSLKTMWLMTLLPCGLNLLILDLIQLSTKM